VRKAIRPVVCVDVGAAVRKGEDVQVKVCSGKSVLDAGSPTGETAVIGRILSPLTQQGRRFIITVCPPVLGRMRVPVCNLHASKTASAWFWKISEGRPDCE
jgi:hypothetical protein